MAKKFQVTLFPSPPCPQKFTPPHSLPEPPYCPALLCPVKSRHCPSYPVTFLGCKIKRKACTAQSQRGFDSVVIFNTFRTGGRRGSHGAPKGETPYFFKGHRGRPQPWALGRIAGAQVRPGAVPAGVMLQICLELRKGLYMVFIWGCCHGCRRRL